MKKSKGYLVSGFALAVALLLLFACSKDDDKKCSLTSFEVTEGWIYGDYYDDYSFMQNLFYDSKNKLIRVSNESYWYDDMTIEYDQDGRISKIVYENENRYMLFTWSGNKVTRQRFNNDTPSAYSYVFSLDNQGRITLIEEWEKYGEENIKLYFLELTWSGGNITVIDEYYDNYWWKTEEVENKRGSRVLQELAGKKTVLPDETHYSTGDKNFMHAYRIILTYDNKPSAFGSASILAFYEPWMVMFYASRNNLTSFTEKIMYYDSDWEYSINFVYDNFNNYGYPGRVEIKFDDYWYYYYDEYSRFWNFGYDCK